MGEVKALVACPPKCAMLRDSCSRAPLPLLPQISLQSLSHSSHLPCTQPGTAAPRPWPLPRGASGSPSLAPRSTSPCSQALPLHGSCWHLQEGQSPGGRPSAVSSLKTGARGTRVWLCVRRIRSRPQRAVAQRRLTLL